MLGIKHPNQRCAYQSFCVENAQCLEYQAMERHRKIIRPSDYHQAVSRIQRKAAKRLQEPSKTHEEKE